METSIETHRQHAAQSIEQADELTEAADLLFARFGNNSETITAEVVRLRASADEFYRDATYHIEQAAR